MRWKPSALAGVGQKPDNVLPKIDLEFCLKVKKKMNLIERRGEQ